jgi:ankyrin repeat protein
VLIDQFINMNRDILNIILNDVIYNDINSIKKTSLICKYIHNNIQLLSIKDEFKSMFNILQKYSDPNTRMNEAAQCGYMYEAAQCGYMNIVQLMIENGALRSAQRRIDCNRVMSYAARGGHMNIVQFMIEKGANRWNWTMNGAARGGHMNIVQFMIEKGANRWTSAMYHAAGGGHMDIVQFMIEKCAQSSIDWNNVIYWAKYNHHINIVELLKQHQSLKN